MLLLVQYTLIFSSVLVLVALGGCVSEHSGVINLGLEGLLYIPLLLLPPLCNYVEGQGKKADSQAHRRQRYTAVFPPPVGKLEHQLNQEFYRIYENQI